MSWINGALSQSTDWMLLHLSLKAQQLIRIDKVTKLSSQNMFVGYNCTSA